MRIRHALVVIVGLLVLGLAVPIAAQMDLELPPGWEEHEAPGPECQDIPEHCIRITTPQTADRFYVAVTNLCAPRIYVTIAIQYRIDEYLPPKTHAPMFGIREGETQQTWVAKSANPTRYHVKWIGSVSSRTDLKCSRRARDWDENPFPE